DWITTPFCISPIAIAPLLPLPTSAKPRSYVLTVSAPLSAPPSAQLKLAADDWPLASSFRFTMTSVAPASMHVAAEPPACTSDQSTANVPGSTGGGGLGASA